MQISIREVLGIHNKIVRILYRWAEADFAIDPPCSEREKELYPYRSKESFLPRLDKYLACLTETCSDVVLQLFD